MLVTAGLAVHRVATARSKAADVCHAMLVKLQKKRTFRGRESALASKTKPQAVMQRTAETWGFRVSRLFRVLGYVYEVLISVIASATWSMASLFLLFWSGFPIILSGSPLTGSFLSFLTGTQVMACHTI